MDMHITSETLFLKIFIESGGQIEITRAAHYLVEN